MLNQIIVPLLSTLLGGALAITASLIANHYNYKKTLFFERRKEVLERRKEIVTILEDIYRSVLKVEDLHIEAVKIKADKKKDKLCWSWVIFCTKKGNCQRECEVAKKIVKL